MELELHEPIVVWKMVDPEDHQHPATAMGPCVVTVTTALGAADDTGRRTLQLPCKLRMPAEGASAALLASPVEFHLKCRGRSPVAYLVHLKDCLPILNEATVEWHKRVQLEQSEVDVHVQVPISSNRQPREIIASCLTYHDRALDLAHQLALHKNKLAVGLLPPILGCAVGVVGFAPVWVPLTLLVGVLGFPVWAIVGVGVAILSVVSVVSALVTVRLVRSARAKAMLREFCQSPGGQYLLFAETGDGRRQALPSTAEVREQVTKYVMASPSRKLLASLVIDFVGNTTFIVPGVGELADMLWAPVSAGLVSALYSESTPSAKYLAFVEEILPFTDFIPTATLAWLKENMRKEDLSAILRKLRKEES